MWNTFHWMPLSLAPMLRKEKPHHNSLLLPVSIPNISWNSIAAKYSYVGATRFNSMSEICDLHSSLAKYFGWCELKEGAGGRLISALVKA